MVGGWYTSFNGTAHTNIVRLHSDGSVDTTFNADIDSIDPNGWVWPIVQQPDGKLIVGGYFGEVNGELGHNNLVRLNTKGAIDASFDVGSGADANTSVLALQPDGKVLVGGAFGYFNGVFRGGITRLNASGSTDTNFNPGTAIQDSYGGVIGIAVQTDGKILIGGAFSAFDGTPRPNVARLNANGSLDTSFVPPTPAWLVQSWIYGLALQPDGKVVLGAWPTNGSASACVARLNPDGSVDPSFQLGSCSADGVWSMTRLANGQIMVGGGFPDFNAQPTRFLVRLHADEALVPDPFTLTARLAGGLLLEWPSTAGFSYQLQSATSLPATNWLNAGLPFAGTGGVLTTNLASGPGPAKFFRVQAGN